MYAQLLVDLFKFLSPFLRNADLTKPTQLLYKVTMKPSDSSTFKLRMFPSNLHSDIPQLSKSNQSTACKIKDKI